MEISWLGVVIGLCVTAVIVLAYFLGKEVGKDDGYLEALTEDTDKILNAAIQDERSRERKQSKSYEETFEDEEGWE